MNKEDVIIGPYDH